MPQVIGIPKETFAEEKRVATVPEVVAKLAKLGFKVIVESGAGDTASISDDAYRASGAEIVDHAAVWSQRNSWPVNPITIVNARSSTPVVQFISRGYL